MMFAKTFCKPGSYVEIAPIGLQAMLVYNAMGLLQQVKALEKVENGHSFRTELDQETLRRIYSIVPPRINLKGGTTYVEGTFFIQKLPEHSTGNIAYCANDEFIALMKKGAHFSFYAGNVYSLAASFKGPLTIRNWLSSNGFSNLPGIVVPVEMKQETLDMLFGSFNCPFDNKFIAAFYIFEGLAEARLTLSNLYYNRVVEFNSQLESDGFIKGVVKLDSNEHLILHLSDALNNRCDFVNKVKILYYRNPEGNVELLRNITDNNITDKTNSYVCPICHKRIVLPFSGPCQCTDMNCLSNLYYDACKMLAKLNLPELSYEQYRKLAENHDILCLTDILALDTYKELKIECTIPEVLSAIVPVSVVSDESIFERLSNSCNNSIDSLMYYLKNPRKIYTELNIDNPLVVRFIKWISDPYNLSSVQVLLSIVNLKQRTKKFEGAPIFRSNSFILTGKFKRGSYKEIASILESYEANIVEDIDTLKTPTVPTAVITGGTNEDISGKIIKSARLLNIPIIDEDKFFQKYEIDNDLIANLL